MIRGAGRYSTLITPTAGSLFHAEFHPFGKTGGKVAACWLFEGPRSAAGIHLPGKSIDLATPNGWTFEGSISERFSFVPNEDVAVRLKYLRTEGGLDVFLDTSTGREVFKPK